MKIKRIIQLYLTLVTGLLPFILNAQLSGKVISENGESINGASVTIKNTGIGTITDSTGFFEILNAPKIPFIIAVSSVNYAPRNITVRSLGEPLNIRLQILFRTDTVVITSRRRREVLQDVPIAVSVVGGKQINESGAFNVNRIKEFIPSLQLYTSNPRNTGVNIRGLGSPFGLTNDGLDPGVGFYVDGVYYARPAAATLDFVDVDRIEVLRGPQGTLFGKNTTAGAINITTRKPSFIPGGDVEVSYGNYGYIQAKASITGPIAKKLAARLSFSGTQRDGTVYNTKTLQHVNDINNLGLRAQFLYAFSENTSLTLSGDYNRQRPDGYAQVVAGVAPTKRAGYRQFDSIITSLNYRLPNIDAKTGKIDAFQRIIDHDTPWKSDNDLGGAAINFDTKLGPGTLTSTTAYRYWNWGPSNDRDFTGLQALAKSQNPAKHKNWSQEVRYAGDFSDRISGVAGLFIIGQKVNITGTEESGRDQWRFAQSSTSSLWRTPGLLDGYGINTLASIKSLSAAGFANIDWKVTEKFHIQPGVRFNYDEKQAAYNRTAYGGLDSITYVKNGGAATNWSTLRGFKNGVYSSQLYNANATERNFTYNISISYKPNTKVNTYATYSTGFKPVGVNVAGLPTPGAGQTLQDLAVIKPEKVRHYEAGIKTTPVQDFALNLSLYNTDIKDYQTNVQSPELGVNRGYIANADKVRVRGAELDANYIVNTYFSFYGAASYTDAKYVKFTNAPLPLEETGSTNAQGQQVAFKDISGAQLPGISKWAGSLGGEYGVPAAFLGRPGRFFIALDGYCRSRFSSSSTPSAYLNVDGYTLANGRLGFKAGKGLSAFVWTRNIFNKNYFEQLLVAGGNAGQYAGVLGDPRTYGITVCYSFNGK